MSSPAEWRPTGAMTIEHAAALWKDAASQLASASDLAVGVSDIAADVRLVMHVDLASIERLDTAGCQILLACREDARRRDLGWRLTGCTPQALEVMRLLCCDGVLEANDNAAITEETER